MDTNWHTWLNDNLKNGCNPAEVAHIMLARDFSTEDILTNIDNHCLFSDYPQDITTQANEDTQDTSDNSFYQQSAAVRITQNKAKKLENDRVQLYLLDDFLTEEECNRLIEHINPVLYPSTVTISNGDDKFRTSRTSDLLGSTDPFLAKIDAKIAAVLGVDLQYSEPMQAQRYDEGNEFKAHTDYFNPDSKEFEMYAGKFGQRTWTFMIYLNETQQGGGTNFVNLGTTFYPKTGQAVIWNNLYTDGKTNPDTIHHGMPVEKGEKIIITKWFRDKPTREMWLT